MEVSTQQSKDSRGWEHFTVNLHQQPVMPECTISPSLWLREVWLLTFISHHLPVALRVESAILRSQGCCISSGWTVMTVDKKERKKFPLCRNAGIKGQGKASDGYVVGLGLIALVLRHC